MFDLLKAITAIENRLAEAWAHNESGQQYQAINALELVLNDLNNELHAEMIAMEEFAQQFNNENLEVY